MTIEAKSQSAQVPLPPREWGPWVLATVLGAVGVGVLVAVLTGLVGRSSQAPLAAPPPVLVAARTPTPASAAAERGAGGVSRAPVVYKRAHGAAVHTTRPIVDAPSPAHQSEGLTYFPYEGDTHIFARWVAGFYPIYGVAQRTFDVNWLLIASIHKQETAFSTASTTYHGLNFAHCCGGPMQFNVTNGPITTWGLVRNAYRYGRRPTAYDHMTAKHPSIYDDFDSIMAAAWLLSANGARFKLNDSAWWAAYDYYGHDATGVAYADQVLARAIGWSQHGFCINCEVSSSLVSAVHEAYGAPVLASLESSSGQEKASRSKRKRRSVAARRGG